MPQLVVCVALRSPRVAKTCHSADWRAGGGQAAQLAEAKKRAQSKWRKTLFFATYRPFSSLNNNITGNVIICDCESRS